MKTLKLALFATLVAIAMVSVSRADEFKSKPKFVQKISMTIEQAVQDPGLVAAMYAQLNPADVLYFPSLPYFAEVKYNGAIYRISGTRTQWLRFFKKTGIRPVYHNNEVTGTE
jgi:hypothetical protein